MSAVCTLSGSLRSPPPPIKNLGIVRPREMWKLVSYSVDMVSYLSYLRKTLPQRSVVFVQHRQSRLHIQCHTLPYLADSYFLRSPFIQDHEHHRADIENQFYFRTVHPAPSISLYRIVVKGISALGESADSNEVILDPKVSSSPSSKKSSPSDHSDPGGEGGRKGPSG